jgi:hypothetical protein
MHQFLNMISTLQKVKICKEAEIITNNKEKTLSIKAGSQMSKCLQVPKDLKQLS